MSDELQEALIKLDGLALRVGLQSLIYREAITTSSPTLPLGGYVGKSSVRRHIPIGVEAR